MNKFKLCLLFLFLLPEFVYSQNSEVVFLQMNDVYEIAPVEGGKYGGLARVSALKQKLLAENPYTFMVLSGDFISPSALSTSEYNGEKINGAQMIDVLNFIGLDFAVFGNHEFDYKKDVLQKRIDESVFTWIASNVKTKRGEALWKFGKDPYGDFKGFPEYVILRLPGYIKDQDIRIGIAGICTKNNQQPYVLYEDYNTCAKRIYESIKDSIDCFIAMTHLAIEDDRTLAGQMPQINLIMGGHEHLNNLEHIGNTIIAKADANAKTVYVHKLVFDINNKLIDIKSELANVDSQVKEDPKAKELVDKWVERAYAGFRSNGFEPNELVGVATIPLDGRDESIRYEQTNLSGLIASAMLAVSKNSEFALFNSGSVRIDDEVKGEITQYDIIRMLPFGGRIIEIELRGSLLLRLLQTGLADSGSGGYLQYAGIHHDVISGKWIYGNDESGTITPDGTYKAAIAAYLLTGLEQNMQFFTKDNPEITKITEPDANDNDDLRNDVRNALIKYMKSGGLK